MIPVKLFISRLSHCSCANRPSSGGISPCNPLVVKSSTVRPVMLLKTLGISPARSLPPREICVNSGKADNHSGIPPVKRLYAKTNCCRYLHDPKPGGTVPASSFLLRYKRSNMGRLKLWLSGGTDPERSFWERYSPIRLDMLNSEDGICPESWFPDSSRN